MKSHDFLTWESSILSNSKESQLKKKKKQKMTKNSNKIQIVPLNFSLKKRGKKKKEKRVIESNGLKGQRPYQFPFPRKHRSQLTTPLSWRSRPNKEDHLTPLFLTVG
jgi:phage repressor protein C with HTH and peptisase S24 domain